MISALSGVLVLPPADVKHLSVRNKRISKLHQYFRVRDHAYGLLRYHAYWSLQE